MNMNFKESKCSVVWPDYQTKIYNGYTHFQQQEEFVDMTLAADGHYVKVHQFIVALASPYLKEIIKSIPVKHPVIFLNNVSYCELCQILEYIYTGEVSIPRQQMKDFMKSATALRLQGISDATAVQQINVTSDEPGLSEEPLQDALMDATEETMAISSELERRMSIVQDNQEPMPDIDDIINAGLVNCASSSSNPHTDTNIDSNNANFLSTKTRQQLKHKTVVGDGSQNVNIEVVDEDSIMYQTNESESEIGNLEDRNLNQNQVSIMPSKAIKSGTIGQIGQKTITTSNTRKRKAGPKSASRRTRAQKSLDAGDPAVPSIVIQSNIGGHSITIKKPSQGESLQDIASMPVLSGKSAPVQISRLRRSDKSMPGLSPLPEDDSTPIPEANTMPQLVFTGATTMEHTSTKPPIPQIILKLPDYGASNVTDAEYPVEPSTSAQPALETNEFVDLIKSDTQERQVLLDQLKATAQHMYTVSNQGSMQMVLNRFMYFLHYTAYNGRKRRWRCIDYRRKQCLAYLDTEDEVIVKRVNAHCHVFHDEKILLKMEKMLVFSTIKSATAGAREMALAGTTVSSENFE